jgi:hypothetical protein
MGSTKETTRVEYPEATAQEREFEQMKIDVLPSVMRQYGIEVTPKKKDLNADPEYTRMSRDIANLQAQEAQLNAQTVGGGGQKLNSKYNQQINNVAQLSNERSKIQKKISDLQEKQSKYAEEHSGDTTFDTREIYSTETEMIGERYGFESPEYKSAVGKFREEEAGLEKKDRELNSKIVDMGIKIASGDYSITPEQQSYVANLFAPMRESLISLRDSTIAEAEKTGKSVNALYDDFDDQVARNKLSIAGAINAVTDQVKLTGLDMTKALENSIETNKALLKMGIEDTALEITKQVARNAASIGRTASDPEFQSQIQQQVAREVSRGTLNLAALESEGKVRISERTGMALEEALQQQVALEASTGEKLEQSKLGRAETAEKTGLKREAAVQGYGAANVNLEQELANLRYNLGTGQIANQIGTGINVAQYREALDAQNAANAQGALGTATGMEQQYQQYRLAQPITTKKTSQSLGGTILGGILGTASAAGSIYGGVTTGAANNALAGYYRQRK